MCYTESALRCVWLTQALRCTDWDDGPGNKDDDPPTPYTTRHKAFYFIPKVRRLICAAFCSPLNQSLDIPFPFLKFPYGYLYIKSYSFMHIRHKPSVDLCLSSLIHSGMLFDSQYHTKVTTALGRFARRSWKRHLWGACPYIYSLLLSINILITAVL